MACFPRALEQDQGGQMFPIGKWQRLKTPLEQAKTHLLVLHCSDLLLASALLPAAAARGCSCATATAQDTATANMTTNYPMVLRAHHSRLISHLQQPSPAGRSQLHSIMEEEISTNSSSELGQQPAIEHIVPRESCDKRPQPHPFMLITICWMEGIAINMPNGPEQQHTGRHSLTAVLHVFDHLHFTHWTTSSMLIDWLPMAGLLEQCKQQHQLMTLLMFECSRHQTIAVYGTNMEDAQDLPTGNNTTFLNSVKREPAATLFINLSDDLLAIRFGYIPDPSRKLGFYGKQLPNKVLNAKAAVIDMVSGFGHVLFSLAAPLPPPAQGHSPQQSLGLGQPTVW
ncbi:hypothetical protein BKA70DRAFT_1218200 [Coprinopsis sp. MPI-PUGE-AT-0042]|nr:hypothetical protein BKA70DRAFT_1218200 [Coprinopsis sp. MPI-PUGE-AT-0042]